MAWQVSLCRAINRGDLSDMFMPHPYSCSGT
jgi:hypothetical protein